MKRIAVLGSTGSIGIQTLDVVRQHPSKLRVTALAANSNGSMLRSQAAEFAVEKLALHSDSAPQAEGIPTGMAAILDIVRDAEVDLVVVAIAGVAGLRPTIAAIEAGKHIALASKEVLVAAGEVVMPLVRKHNTVLTPIDSEHSAIFQCLQGYRLDQVSELILTASGGPFRGKKRGELESITVAQALDHPTWKMGGKITIDSATLMNKGLETIEARWLFNVPIEKVSVVIHPQSVIHSMARFQDGSVLGQLGWPDMRLPIQYALLYPERAPNEMKMWNPIETPNLTFEPVDEETFPSLGLARQSVIIGGTMPCAMNAANEEATAAFLQNRVKFLEIAEIVEETMLRHSPQRAEIELLLETDAWARATAHEIEIRNTA